MSDGILISREAAEMAITSLENDANFAEQCIPGAGRKLAETLREAAASIRGELPMPASPATIIAKLPKNKEVWGDANDPETWRFVVGVLPCSIRFACFVGDAYRVTPADWDAWASHYKAVRIFPAKVPYSAADQSYDDATN